MARMTSEQEAAYALDYGVDRGVLSPAAQAEYDRLAREHAGPNSHTATLTQPQREPGHCPVCGDDLPAEPCDNCGWERGLVLAYQKDLGDVVEVGFRVEKRHKMILWCGLLACALGAILLIWGIATGGPAIAVGLLLGPLALAAGVLTLKITKRGRAWWGIPAKDKALATPGLIVGGGFGLVLIPATLIAIAVMALYFNALGDVNRSLRA